MPVNRRQFISISGATLGAATLASGLTTNWWGLDPNVVHDPGTAGVRVVPSFCEICFWKCGVLAHVNADGKGTKLEGNPQHPLSQGKLCPRGTGGTGLLYDPDRLRTPLVRREKRGSQSFEAVSWDAALDLVAEKLDGIRTKYGPEALALFSHGYGGSWFKHLVKAYGTGNITAPSYAQCRGAREVAFSLTYGSPVGSPEALDIENSRVLTLLGSHLGENMHNTQVQEMATAIDRGAELVVVDPRFSTAAGKARYWLPIKPGTDLALLLAWMHVIVEEKLYDRDYLAQYAVGFEPLVAHLKDKTPGWASVETGIDTATIVETARFIAGARPASLVHPGRRTAWYGDDTQRARGVAILNALLGTWGRRGGFFLPAAASVPKFEGAPDYPPHKATADMAKGEVFPFADSVLAQGLRNATLPGTAEYDIKAWMVYGTNLLQALPERKKTMEALQQVEFSVAIDVLPAEITGWMDVVLPEATYLERHDDLHNPGWKRGFVALRKPVVPPMYESKPGWWIAKQLGDRLGLGAFFPYDDAEQYLNARLAKAGRSVADFDTTGVLLDEPAPLFIEDGLAPTFATPSGKIELFSQQMADAGLPGLPPYTRPAAPPPGHQRLLFGRAPTQTFGRTTNNRFLGEVFAENVVWVNARVAKEQGLRGGDHVDLIDTEGARTGPVAVKVTQRIRPDSVYVVHGYGQDAPKLRFTHGRGASDSALMSHVAIDPAMGGTGMNVNFVRLEKRADTKRGAA
ncbi:MAG: molybdopterin-dependent oxidoreductase [Myxococcales bacterium]|nr:molybdopterin-dependent oxidoreductase [Myxococcales bacterium]